MHDQRSAIGAANLDKLLAPLHAYTCPHRRPSEVSFTKYCGIVVTVYVASY